MKNHGGSRIGAGRKSCNTKQKIDTTEIGQLVRDGRFENNLSLRELSELTGFTGTQHASAVETGRMSLPWKYVKKYCEVLGLSEVEVIRLNLKCREDFKRIKKYKIGMEQGDES